MDPITITTSIFGLLKASATIVQFLGPYVSAARDTPKIVTQVHSEVVQSRFILLALEGLANNLSSVPVKRAALIQVDQLVAVFTDGVLLFSELESSLPSSPSAEGTSTKVPLWSRLQWARKESTFSALLTRLQGFKGSISLMLNLLQSDSDMRAAEHQRRLSSNISALLESNQSLSRRLMNLEDTFEVRTIGSRRHSLAQRSIIDGATDIPQPNNSSEDGLILENNDIDTAAATSNTLAASSFDFEDDLETSRVYRRAQRDTMDFSFRSSVVRTNAWSVFSGYSLSEVSILSAIALPLFPEEIENPQHYEVKKVEALKSTVSCAEPLFDQYLGLERRLCQIPELSEIFDTARDDSEVDDEDPLSLLIRIFRRGAPLLLLLKHVPDPEVENYLDPYEQLVTPKGAIYQFIKACIRVHSLDFGPEDCFSVGDLLDDVPTGHTKVIGVITKVLEIIRAGNNWAQLDPPTLSPDEERRRTNPSIRDIMIQSLLEDERSYVTGLESLLELQRKIEADGSLVNDSLKVIFGTLHEITNAQISFLMRVEMTARKPTASQYWGAHFKAWSGVSDIYGHFMTSEKRAREFLRAALMRPQQAGGKGLSAALVQFLRLLYLPSQRVPKYAGFLQDLHQYGDLSGVQSVDVLSGSKAVQTALQTINAAIKKKELEEILEDFVQRVSDWKGHIVERFGDLLLYDRLDVVTARSDIVRPYHIYLFEHILLCAQESSPTKRSTRSLIFGRPKKSPVEPEPKTNLILKGRIFGTNLTDVTTLTKPASFTCQVFWKGDPGIENFSIRFPNESKMKTWAREIEAMKKRSVPAVLPPAQDMVKHFPWMSNTSYTSNPYAEEEDSDDDTYHDKNPKLHTGQSLRAPLRLPKRSPPPRFPLPDNKPDGNWL